jgi:pSer/pThr/pTyr-binding forkhead associated (FHA) protein
MSEQNNCPNCGHSLMAGELACPECLIPVIAVGKTTKIDGQRVTAPKQWTTGKAFAGHQMAVGIYIQDTELILPDAEIIIMGRAPNQVEENMAYVDLTPFGADDLGVSRLHLRLVRKEDMLFGSDLNSTNGSFINGRPMAANVDRLLRDNDELQLGDLKFYLKFQ